MQVTRQREGLSRYRTITGYYTSEIGLHQELGDDGQMVLAEYKGCTHPEHQK